MKDHTIITPERKYDVHIDHDLLPRVLEYVRQNISPRRQAILTDQNVVDAGHLDRLDPKRETPTFTIEPDENKGVESKKNVVTYGQVLDFLDSNKFEKRDVLVCLGGGVIGDLGGFVALTYKRGKMIYIQVPTTTLSQADSSVGGKVAIDGLVSKNVAGDVYQPHFVAADIMSLITLDPRNFRSGLVESVKHGLILDKNYFAMLERNIGRISPGSVGLLEEIALKNVQIKGSVVRRDPNDQNYRHSLNFGHTIGHAVEQASGYSLYHGEAVALGLLSALYISRELRGLSREEFDRAEKLLVDGLGMRAKVPPEVDRAVVEDKLANDKKVINGVNQFVTIAGIGKLYVEDSKYSLPIESKQLLKESMDYIFN
ncbi:3-dehydroquinate synthase [Candidatus Woesearchaeota archaeon]|nr:3-dehydroquinate synthase [Candidatus Woesearchaeota archaeon]